MASPSPGVDRTGQPDEAVSWEEERAALRRVSELVAQGADRGVVLNAIVTETHRLFPIDYSVMHAFDDDDGAARIVALHRAPPGLAVGDRALRIPEGMVLRAFHSGRPARVESYADIGTPEADYVHSLGIVGGAGAPIIVDGRVWGVLTANTTSAPPPHNLEHRLADFADLAATAIATTQAKDELRVLADEQAALRRVAELAAQGTEAGDFFQHVVKEASDLLRGAEVLILQFEGDGASLVVGAIGGHVPRGLHTRPSAAWPSAAAWRTGQPARIDDFGANPGRAALAQDYGVHAAVAVPIKVHGAVWGIMVVTSTDEPLPPDTEQRLSQFANIAAAAIASTMARVSLLRLADEQAALRRVAELVARGTEEESLFAAVTNEAAALMGNETTTLVRFDDHDAFTVLATHHGPAAVGSALDHPSADLRLIVEILRTKKPVRLEAYDASGRFFAHAHSVGSSVAVPIVVDDRMWGLLGVVTTGHRLPTDTEVSLQQFAELAAVAIANAENKAQLKASRARVVATADETRRRLQRDVHDGAQQRLVQTVINLKLARSALPEGSAAADRVAEALQHAERASRELRDLVRGILPAALTRGGLQTGLTSLIGDISIPVQLRVTAPPMPREIETTAYFIVAEALTNVVKHARASRADVTLTMTDASLCIDVTDDGVGGADAAAGTGLTGLRDRVDAADGTLTLTSAIGQGTTLHAELPVTEVPRADPPRRSP